MPWGPVIYRIRKPKEALKFGIFFLIVGILFLVFSIMYKALWEGTVIFSMFTILSIGCFIAEWRKTYKKVLKEEKEYTQYTTTEIVEKQKEEYKRFRRILLLLLLLALVFLLLVVWFS